MDKERFEKQYQIVLRAEALGIGQADRFTRMLDIGFADKQFNLRLDDFLNADDENFTHDFVGIQNHMDREQCLVVDCFVPRFAGKKEEK